MLVPKKNHVYEHVSFSYLLRNIVVCNKDRKKSAFQKTHY
jgi:hypothetical protein